MLIFFTPSTFVYHLCTHLLFFLCNLACILFFSKISLSITLHGISLSAAALAMITFLSILAWRWLLKISLSNLSILLSFRADSGGRFHNLRNQRERRQRVAPEIFDDKILHSENWIVIGGDQRALFYSALSYPNWQLKKIGKSLAWALTFGSRTWAELCFLSCELLSQ